MIDVAVVGGGFAGLSAAAALADAGKRVLVLDARPQLGGRATAFTDRETGELVDNGQHVMFGCYRETFRFLRRIGAEANVRTQPALELPCYDNGVRSVLRCPPLPSPLHLLAGVLDWDPIPWGERLASLRVAPSVLRARREVSRTGTVRTDADRTVTQWLDDRRQGTTLREWLWKPLTVAALNQSPDHASAAPFLRILAEMFGSDPAAASLVLPLKPLHLMYAEPARTYVVARGGEVRTNALTRVITDGRRVTGVDVRGERIAVRTVISAVPWYALGTLFSTPPSQLAPVIAAASGMESMPIVTVNLWYDREVMTDVFAGLPGRTMQWVFDKRLAFGGSASHLSLVSSGASEIVGMSSEDLSALAADEVEAAIPGARLARVVRATVIREKRSTFSLAPGQPSRPGARTPIEGLFPAGDWTDTGLPATIESAVISGHRTAAAVLDTATAAVDGRPSA